MEEKMLPLQSKMMYFISYAIIFSLLLAGCGEKEKTQGDIEMEMGRVSDNLTNLKQFVELTPEPNRVSWQSFTFEGSTNSTSNDWGIVAVLYYDESTIDEVFSKVSESSKLYDVHIAQEAIRPWLPTSMQEIFANDAKHFNNAVPVYSPDPFAISPLLHGFCFVIEEEEVVFLYLHTK
jgi:hypothetical protein